MTPGHASVLLAAAALAFPACAHFAPLAVQAPARHCDECGRKLTCTNLDCPLRPELPDAGAVDPCAPSGRQVNLLTPEERRLFCLHPEPRP